MISSSYTSYPKIHHLGHAAVKDLLLDPVLVEEKLDGSQFSMAVLDTPDEGRVLRCRSKGAQINIVAPEKLFEKAVKTAKKLEPHLHPGWTYRCECLVKPKHNTLAYDRVPQDYLIIFDINPSQEEYLSYDAKKAEAERLGLEVTPILYQGTIKTIEFFRELLKTQSVLGGQLIEGVVIKNYHRFGRDGKALMGKFVSESFKETHAGDWKERNPNQGDIIQRLVSMFKTDARWAKAVQHLKERGKLEDSPRDIGALIKETQGDIVAECKEEMAKILVNWALPSVLRGATAGIAEWYKDRLVSKQFEDEESNETGKSGS